MEEGALIGQVRTGGWGGPRFSCLLPSNFLILSALQDAAYHCTASLFYLSASVLEALATILMYEGYTYKQYHENISAVVSNYQPAHAPLPPQRLWDHHLSVVSASVYSS